MAKNKLGYLSVDIKCFSKQTVFREHSSRIKSVGFEKQIMREINILLKITYLTVMGLNSYIWNLHCELQHCCLFVHGQISEHIFVPHEGYCGYYPSNKPSFENWGILWNSDIPQFKLGHILFQSLDAFRSITYNPKYLMD